MSFDFKLVNGDLSIVNGRPEVVENEFKLVQDMLKMLFTTTGESTAHPWYGTPLLNRVIGQNNNLDLLQVDVEDSVNYALNNLQLLQELQEKDNQFISPKEAISSVEEVEIKLDSNDPRKLVIKIRILSRSNEVITESFSISI